MREREKRRVKTKSVKENKKGLKKRDIWNLLFFLFAAEKLRERESVSRWESGTKNNHASASLQFTDMEENCEHTWNQFSSLFLLYTCFANTR